MDDGAEVAGLGIAGTADVELFLYEVFCLERHFGLGVADADDASRESHLVDSHLIGCAAANGFDDHVGAEAGGHLQQAGMHIVGLRVDGVAGAHLTGQGQFLVVDVGSHNGGTALGTAHDGSHTYHTTADDQYHVDIRHLSTTHCMESHAHRLYQGTGTG